MTLIIIIVVCISPIGFLLGALHGRREFVIVARRKAHFVTMLKIHDGDQTAAKKYLSYGTYWQMMFSFKKWTYEDLYPEWEN